MPKKKKTHAARLRNWTDLGRTSSLFERMRPRLFLLLLTLMLLLLRLADAIIAEARDLDGVEGQSSHVIAYFIISSIHTWAGGVGDR